MRDHLAPSSPGLSRRPRSGGQCRASLSEATGTSPVATTWLAFALALVALVCATPTSAQQYPNKMIRIVSPAPPGGSTDIVARLVQPGLQDDLKQTVIVEARGGAGGYIGSEYVTKAPADGYTLLVGGAFAAITATLQKNPSYSPRRDLVPVAILASVPNILVAGPRLKDNTVAELIADARARSTSAPTASAPHCISPASCSSCRPASGWSTSPTAAGPTASPRSPPAKST